MQRTIKFFRDLQAIHAPEAAPAKVVRQVESPHMAMMTTMVSRHHKLLTIATKIGVSESHLSRIINGKRSMPRWFPAAFCWATGCNLLQQHLDMRDALSEPDMRATALRLALELQRVAA